MRGWRLELRTVVEPLLGLPTLVAACLLFLPLYAPPLQHVSKQTSSGMDAPPPATLESFRSLGGWANLERRILGSTPYSYRLEAPPTRALGIGLLARREPDAVGNLLVLQGQRRLEGG